MYLGNNAPLLTVWDESTSAYENRAISRPEKVLVVEDDECLKLAIYRGLRSINKKIIADWAVNAEEAKYALQSTEGEPYDLIISDILLPGNKTGFDIAEYCRYRFSKSNLILMSAIPTNEYLEIMKRQSSCPAFLHKPFTMREFVTIVREMLPLMLPA